MNNEGQKVRLGASRYGKSRVRVAKVTREDNGVHTLRELNVEVLVTGDFADSFLQGDNSLVLPTDTMKNTLYVLAARHGIEGPERFGALAGQFFLERNPAMRSVELTLRETRWERLPIDGAPHPHAFRAAGLGTPVAQVTAKRDAGVIRLEVESGVEDLCLLKTGGSGFAGFRRDDLTTLPETDDRLLSTLLKGRWLYRQEPVGGYEASNAVVLDAMLAVFAKEYSVSVQASLYGMGRAAIGAVSEIVRVTLGMPNRHYLPFDLSRFGLANTNEVFCPVDEPHGQIEASVERVEETEWDTAPENPNRRMIGF